MIWDEKRSSNWSWRIRHLACNENLNRHGGLDARYVDEILIGQKRPDVRSKMRSPNRSIITECLIIVKFC